ncbi:MAG: rane-bound lytic murein transglycosylase [Rhodospirillaceae bacterium]|nr:rane-bound lytic murein transglycosylase [Rhodospirillaceae bacterium]
MRRFAGALLLLAALGACAGRPSTPPEATVPGLRLHPVTYLDLPGWGEDRQSEAAAAFRRSCTKIATLPPDRALGPSGLAGSARDWQAACRAAAALPAGDDRAARAFFEQGFRPYRLSDAAEDGTSSADQGFFTGYYLPRVAGSLRRRAGFDIPLYRRPPDLVEVADGQVLTGNATAGRRVNGGLTPYYSRSEIDAGALAGRGLELVWLASPIDAFFVSIQGSAEVALAEGGDLGIGFAGSNGRPYLAIGRLLVERGAIARDQISLQTIRAWLLAHPDEAQGLMQQNPRYIFFRETLGEGPSGAQGVTLTPGRSLAVDPGFLPLGAPLFIDTADATGRPLRRLMLAQDRGAAIKGPLRADFYWGTGDEAEAAAGPMKSHGALYLLLPAGVEVAGR